MHIGSGVLFLLTWALVSQAGALAFVDNSMVEPDIFQMQQNLTAMTKEVTSLRNTVASLRQELNNTAALAAMVAANPHTQPVAFTVHLTKTITNLTQHVHVSFDNVITNVGGAYSKATGHFTAPVFGVYVFYITATNTPGNSVSLSLMKNGQRMAVTLAHGSSTTASQWETSTIPAAVSLVAGDEVWVQNESHFSPVETLDGHNYSSFTGYLLYKL